MRGNLAVHGTGSLGGIAYTDRGYGENQFTPTLGGNILLTSSQLNIRNIKWDPPSVLGHPLIWVLGVGGHIGITPPAHIGSQSTFYGDFYGNAGVGLHSRSGPAFELGVIAGWHTNQVEDAETPGEQGVDVVANNNGPQQFDINLPEGLGDEIKEGRGDGHSVPTHTEFSRMFGGRLYIGGEYDVNSRIGHLGGGLELMGGVSPQADKWFGGAALVLKY